MDVELARPQRATIIRAVFAGGQHLPGVQLRAAPSDAPGDSTDPANPVMFGHFVRFGEWTEIDSWYEGNFLEQFARGSMKKTFKEQRDRMRCLFQHGMDPQIGDKPLGPIDQLAEDAEGGYYEVPLLDASYVRDDVLPGLEAGLYGASFRFSVVREEFNQEPGVSAYNPKGLPERTIKEASVSEFGPVTFPAYQGATAGIRSLTDEFLISCLSDDPERVRAMLEATTVRARSLDDARARRRRVFEQTLGDDFSERAFEAYERAFTAAAEAPAEDDDEELRDDAPAPTSPPTSPPETKTAPPSDGAGPRAHPVSGRRGSTPRTPLYGATPKETKPPWKI